VIEAKAAIKFKKFNLNDSSYSFPTGLNIIYGESGVGKSNLLDAFLNKKLPKRCNFNIKTFVDNLNVYKIFQNPDHQIISSTVSNEITFSGECKQLPPSQLKIILDNALEYMPNDISPMMNPGFLSGGEKEILNILTAIDYSPDILLIDDGLSFLSYQNKVQCIELLKNWASDTSGIIIWATSDYGDLKFSNFCWEIRLDGIEKIDKIVNKKYKDITIPKGRLNLE